MHVPAIYRPRTHEDVWTILAERPLAVLTTNGPDLPYATHLPVILTGEPVGSLVGRTLLGHMNRANPHWDTLDEGLSGKLIFSGPGSYVSPALYESGPAAPTWDFVTVHLAGVLSPIATKEETLSVVQQTAATLEESFGYGWSDEASTDYFRNIVSGVGAFAFIVAEEEAMFKLSQEKSAHTRHRIAARLRADEGSTSRQQIADLIARHCPVPGPQSLST